jgi:3-phenylpropionate/cinnamic acid dioxygenase small subunit
VDVADRLAIEDLYARYCVALDTGDEEGWVATFTEDGEFYGRGGARGRAGGGV